MRLKVEEAIPWSNILSTSCVCLSELLSVLLLLPCSFCLTINHPCCPYAVSNLLPSLSDQSPSFIWSHWFLIPVSKEGARPLFSKANKGSADPEQFHLPPYSHHDCSQGVHSNFQFMYLYVLIESLQQVLGDSIFLTRVTIHPDLIQIIWGYICCPRPIIGSISFTFKLSWFNSGYLLTLFIAISCFKRGAVKAHKS